MAAHYLKDVPCEACGAMLRISSLARRHCQNDECRLAYVIAWFKREERYDAHGHMPWSGPRRVKSKGTPGVAIMHASNLTDPRRRNEYRVLDIAALLRDGREADGARWHNDCGDPLCVALDHWHVDAKAGQVNRKPAAGRIMAHLPAAPLLRLVDAREAAEKAERQGDLGGHGQVCMVTRRTPAISHAIAAARKQGYVTVSAADQICIDYLGLHPAEVYGDLFFEVGTDAA